jgi:hypothetical protein
MQRDNTINYIIFFGRITIKLECFTVNGSGCGFSGTGGAGVKMLLWSP